jgi:hypothetical protein
MSGRPVARRVVNECGPVIQRGLYGVQAPAQQSGLTPAQVQALAHAGVLSTRDVGPMGVVNQRAADSFVTALGTSPGPARRDRQFSRLNSPPQGSHPPVPASRMNGNATQRQPLGVGGSS